MKLILAAAALIALNAQAFAWDGVNVDTGTSITIDDGSDLSEGNTLDAIDNESGDEFQIVIQSASDIDGGTEIQVTNTATNQTETYDFADPDEADQPQ
jgi:hypothetical protein